MSFFGNRRQSEPAPAPAPQKLQTQPQTSTAPPQPVGFETVLGANCTLEGTLRSSANVRLDGTFTGTLEITGNVLVGETAKITADINAKNISIAGAVRGNVSGKKVQLLRTGRIWGDIHAAALTTEEGAFIDGKIAMSTQEPDVPPGDEAPESGEFVTPEPTVIGMGAVEEEETVEPSGDTSEDGMVDNISEGLEDELPVGGDWTEGQTNVDFDQAQPDDDEPRQST